MGKLYENFHILHFQKRIASAKNYSRKYGMDIYFFLNHSTSASCTWKLNRPSKPEDLFFGQPITHTALPFCIAIDILWNRKKVVNFSPVVIQINEKYLENVDELKLEWNFIKSWPYCNVVIHAFNLLIHCSWFDFKRYSFNYCLAVCSFW